MIASANKARLSLAEALPYAAAQVLQRWRPFSLHAVHFRALKESVKQLRNTDILLPWHTEHGWKPKPPQEGHSCGCCTLCSGQQDDREQEVC